MSDLPPDEPNPVGRPSSFKPEFCAQAEELCKLGAIDKELAEFFEVDERTINRWKEAHPEFRQSIRAGKIIADIAVAGRLHQRALGFEFEEAHPIKLKTVEYSDGKRVRESERVEIVSVKRVIPPDTLAGKFWLTNRQRDKWAERISGEITGKDGAPLIPDASSRDVARAVLDILREAQVETKEPPEDAA
jgi:hypothetical protein